MSELAIELIVYFPGLPLALLGLAYLAKVYVGFARPRPFSFLLLIGFVTLIAICGESAYLASVLRHHNGGMLSLGQGKALRAAIQSSFMLSQLLLIAYIYQRSKNQWRQLGKENKDERR